LAKLDQATKEAATGAESSARKIVTSYENVQNKIVQVTAAAESQARVFKKVLPSQTGFVGPTRPGEKVLQEVTSGFVGPLPPGERAPRTVQVTAKQAALAATAQDSLGRAVQRTEKEFRELEKAAKAADAVIVKNAKNQQAEVEKATKAT